MKRLLIVIGIICISVGFAFTTPSDAHQSHLPEQCHAELAPGFRCGADIVFGTLFCAMHQPNPILLQCPKVTNGIRCNNWVSANGYCQYHQPD